VITKPLSAIDRPLSLRLRADLQAVPVPMSGTTTWIVKDPVALEHFQFTAEEYVLLDQLRKPVSIAQLQRVFARTFGPRTISAQAAWSFVNRLHDAGLLISHASGQGAELLHRARRERLHRWALAWTSLLAIRFRGVDPDRLLSAAQERLRWLFSPAAFLVVLAVMLYAAVLVIGHFAEFRQRLPELGMLLDPRNLPWLLLAIAAAKVLHELGHALACKHFGGEVRELGFMLLVFAPCLYCDVSDAWRLPSKWQRIAVSAAGMFVEWLLAAMATIVWWYAQPGIVQLVAMNLMIVCTVNTLLVNGNPLLRYDGYYILSDLVEMPNLWQRSRDVLRELATRWFLAPRGTTTPDPDPLIPAHRRGWLALYAALSNVYQVLVFVAILWGMVVFLYPYHLQNLAYAVGAVVLGTALLGPARGTARLLRDPLRRGELRAGRLVLATAISLITLAGILSLRVNYYVAAPLVLLPENAARVYATTAGTLNSVLPAGQHVTRGEPIAQLSNTDIELELARLEGEHRLRQMRVEHLQRLRALDREANDQLPVAQAALADSERRLKELRQEARQLTLTAPVDGIVIAPPRRTSAGAFRPAARLAKWSGSLLEEANRGALVEPGTLVCLVGDPARLNAVLLVDDTDVRRLRPGQPVRLRLKQLPGQVIVGQLIDIARHDTPGNDNKTATRADLDALFADLTPPRRSSALYQALVRLDAPLDRALVIGGRGQAKITAERITLAHRIARWFAQTFRLPL
jgi:putative peptide zinc metalloprotease protein